MLAQMQVHPESFLKQCMCRSDPPIHAVVPNQRLQSWCKSAGAVRHAREAHGIEDRPIEYMSKSDASEYHIITSRSPHLILLSIQLRSMMRNV